MLNKNEKKEKNSPIALAFQNFEGLQVSLYNDKKDIEYGENGYICHLEQQ